MNDILNSFLIEAQTGAFQVAVSGIAVCLLALAAARLWGRRSAPRGYGILMGGVAGLLAVPALVLIGHNLPATFLWPPAPFVEELVKIPAERLPELLSRPEPEPLPVETGLSWAPVLGIGLAATWAMGIIIGLSRLSLALRKRPRVFMGRTWQAAFWTDELQARLARQLGLKEFPAVHLSPVTPMPMVLGHWRPKIVLPEQAPAAWGQAQWEAVLLHEAAHIARRDHWAVLAQRGAALLFWWCPLVYALNRRLNALRESICDDYALLGPCDPVAYAELLVDAAERLLSLKTVPVSLALLNSARGGLEARVTRLLEKERRPMTKLSLPGKLLGATFLVAACMFTTAATALSGGQPQPQKKVQIKIIVDGKEIDLGDAQLWEHIGAAQKKAGSADVSVPRLDNLVNKVVNLVYKVDDLVVDVGPVTRYFAFQATPDPRIEELVQQAEAIKPGSGAQIRSALQGQAKTDDKSHEPATQPPSRKGNVPKDTASSADKTSNPASKPGNLKVYLNNRATTAENTSKPAWVQVHVADPAAGPKIIILKLEDGKVIQLREEDLKRIPDMINRITVREADLNVTPARKGAKNPPGNTRLDYEVRQVEKSSTRTAANDLDALRRQIERLSAELQAIKQSLDATKSPSK